MFTNSLVKNTMDIVINNVYNHSLLLGLQIRQHIFKTVLFYYHLGNIYKERNGVIGSPLVWSSSNIFLTNLENRVFRETAKPNIYARYIDKIVARNINIIKSLKYPREMLF